MRVVSVLAVGALVACGNAKPASQPTQTSQTTTPMSDVSNHEPTPVSPNVAVSGDILAACKIEFSNATEAPKFDYDNADLLPDDVHVLSQVATCLTTGPLKGRNVELVGRADPRGTAQYNMALGANRAHRVTDFLQQHGVTRVRETSRGAIDATGRDESGWRTDRRVDLILGS
jgi:outer membrane protein OmpA-like peptidoglycan-associated protein